MVLETVRGYDDMVKAMKETEYEEIHSGLSAKVSEIGSQGRRGASRPTEEKALRIMRRNAEYEKQTKAVEQALIHFPKEIRNIIMNNIVHGVPLKWDWQGERDSSLGRKKRAFVILVAQNLGLI